ncbi:unnamed protein product [Parascedosporium putredinis]|uniref:DUF833-domain-containing protein n=1 Tax=Parascedosporium putredinis TaxID=1442378 RepID=A0A9P1GYZ2_9PEZI|nr:unnamed protein product [Parascedosporium putredinis]CAI7992295.1 unnamed protein product [Parascedosporium putredinis]
MCIVFLTTAHPDYALIVVDNRDEFILRPTSRPEWWRHPNGPEVLSARDLQRSEKGTWMGITKDGVFAVLTNYRETDVDDADHPIHAIRSRGDGGVKGVGGFSMVCGKLRKSLKTEGGRNIDPIAIVSNRASHVDHVPWIGQTRGEVCALSNIGYGDVDSWPKLEDGKRMLGEVITQAIKENLSEDQLVDKLFGILDDDKLPRYEGMSLMDYVSELKQSIFIPAVGDEPHRIEMEESMARGKTGWPSGDSPAAEEAVTIPSNGTSDSAPKVADNNLGFATGMYGTQRQTMILVDWDGQVTFRERALYDSHGNPIPRGQADEVFRFKIEDWDNDDR